MRALPPLLSTASPSHCRPQQHRTPIERWVKVAIAIVSCSAAALPLRCCCIALGASIQFELFLYVLQDLSKLQATGAEGRGPHSGVARGRRVALGRSLHTLNPHRKKKRNMSFKSKNYNLKVNLHSLQLGKRPGKSLEIKLFRGKTLAKAAECKLLKKFNNLMALCRKNSLNHCKI